MVTLDIVRINKHIYLSGLGYNLLLEEYFTVGQCLQSFHRDSSSSSFPQYFCSYPSLQHCRLGSVRKLKLGIFMGKFTAFIFFLNLKIMTKVIIASVILTSVTYGKCNLWQVLLMANVLWQV